jgi:hypothetical protein
MNAFCLTLFSLLFSLTSSLAMAQAAGVGGAQSGGTGAAMTVYIDPQTGAILSQPPPGHTPLALDAATQAAMSTSDKGLVQVPSPVPGGGVMIDLQGRFQSPFVVVLDETGTPKTHHLNESPAAQASHSH